MPCMVDPYTEEELRRIAAQDAVDVRIRLNKLTEMLCDACQLIEKTPRTKMTKGLADWWHGHKKSKGHIPTLGEYTDPQQVAREKRVVGVSKRMAGAIQAGWLGLASLTNRQETDVRAFVVEFTEAVKELEDHGG